MSFLRDAMGRRIAVVITSKLHRVGTSPVDERWATSSQAIWQYHSHSPMLV